MSTIIQLKCAVNLKMHRIVAIVISFLAFAAAVEVTSPRGYHLDVGIPLAAEIKDNEEKYMASRVAFNYGRIIGGVLAPEHAHPYFAGLLIDIVGISHRSVCGSTLITRNRLLTAAHCWFDGQNQAWQFNVILGTQFLYWGGTRISTTRVLLHPQWTPANLLNDVAMIYLPTPVTFSVSIQPVALPTVAELRLNFVNEWANAVGFGRTSDAQPGASQVLSHVNLQVISEQQCRAIYGSNFVFSSTLCTNGAGGVGVCGGDSGGPLAIKRNGRNLLIGVSSFAAFEACEGGFPSGFARVTSFINFINQHLW